MGKGFEGVVRTTVVENFSPLRVETKGNGCPQSVEMCLRFFFKLFFYSLNGWCTPNVPLKSI